MLGTVIILFMWDASGWLGLCLWLGSFFFARLDTVSRALKLHDEFNDLSLRGSAPLGSSIIKGRA